MKVWLPAIRAGSGTDVFTERLATLIKKCGYDAEITWFPHHFELHPWDLQKTSPPLGTKIVWTNTWNGFAFKRAGIFHITTEHHCVFDPSFRPYKNFAQHLYHIAMIRQFERLSFASAEILTTVSHYTANRLLALGVSNRIKVFQNWINTNLYSPIQIFKPTSVAFRVLFVGNLTRRKGGDLLIPIIDALGEGFELRAVCGLRGRDNLRHPRIILLNQLDEESLISEYRSCTVLLCPSRYEGFGYAPLEAMACGIPVVASDNSALPEVIDDGVTGLLCPTDNVDSFVAAIRKIANSPSLGQWLGSMGRLRAQRLFSEEARYQEMDKLLKCTLQD